MDETMLFIILVFLVGLIIGIFGTLLVVMLLRDATSKKTISGPSVHVDLPGAIAVGETGHCRKYHKANIPAQHLPNYMHV